MSIGFLYRIFRRVFPSSLWVNTFPIFVNTFSTCVLSWRWAIGSAFPRVCWFPGKAAHLPAFLWEYLQHWWVATNTIAQTRTRKVTTLRKKKRYFEIFPVCKLNLNSFFVNIANKKTNIYLIEEGKFYSLTYLIAHRLGSLQLCRTFQGPVHL